MPQLPNPRKRKSSTQTAAACKDQRRLKRVRSTTFWDNLSQIHLDRTALQELDRRTPRNIAKSERPVTRSLSRCERLIVPPNLYLHRCGAKTAEELRRFARQGGPDMSGVRGYTRSLNRHNPTPTPSDRHSTETSSTRNTTPYSPNFQQHLIDNSIFPNGYEYPDGRIPPLPSNWEEINQRLRVPLSPQVTLEEFKKFKKADVGAFKEKQVSTFVIPILEGSTDDAKCTAGGIKFCNLKPITDGSIAPGNPDIYYGARPEQLDRCVRVELRNLIIPTTQEDLPICPNFFVAAKGPDGSLAVALRQALYDGALGARGIHELRNYGRVQSVLHDRASVITSVYHGGTLRLYTIHRVEPTHEYYMHQIRSFSLPDSFETFEQGLTFLRNGKNWAQEERNLAIDQANTVSSVSSLTPRVESEDDQYASSEEGASPSSTRYTTPPSGELVTSYSETTDLTRADSNKRTRRNVGSPSPVHQQKRNRVQEQHDSPARSDGKATTRPKVLGTT